MPIPATGQDVRWLSADDQVSWRAVVRLVAELPRLSLLMTRLEQRGLAYRRPDPRDGRFTQALLTAAGHRKVVDAAPGHVATVRALVVDALGPDRLRRLGEDAGEIVRRIDTAPS